MKILFVCTGNTCRSPMAAAICESLAKEKSLSVQCESAGLFADIGSPMTALAEQALKELYNIEYFHRSRAVNKFLLCESDLVVAMTGSHLASLKSTFGESEKFIVMPEEISDPFGGDLDDYISSCTKIRSGIEKLFNSGIIK